ncbi:hypothetical protein OIU76_025740 [Salix suchowensis]|nr:hypothetical protein OIU76_025740 [Salix suchowensis]
MQNPRMAPSSEIQNAKPRKKKAAAPRASMIQLEGNDIREVKQRVPPSLRPGQKSFKKELEERRLSDCSSNQRGRTLIHCQIPLPQ